MGVGSVATTQQVKAVGRAQLSSIYACALAARQYGVPVIADGGICNTGCLIKALAIGMINFCFMSINFIERFLYDFYRFQYSFLGALFYKN
jgi:isopentenyl diphosphate isomerase/L-lactate dehydrogenase-like FMN-dependent dehydrogenase